MGGSRDEDEIVGRESAFFDAYHEHGALHPRGTRLRMERDAAVLRAARSGRSLGRVLSLGCGDGLFELSLAGDAREIVGVDVSREAIARAQAKARERRVGNARFVRASATEYAETEPFDTVLCISFLHHLPPRIRPAFLDHLRGLLAPGGLLFATEPNAEGALRRLGRRLMGRRYATYHSPDEVELDPKETRAELEQAGFAAPELVAIDWTLIPANHLLAGGPGWPLPLAAALDRLLNAVAPHTWATGFAILARAGDPPA